MEIPSFAGDLSAAAVLVIVVLLVLFGKLRPNTSVQEVREDRDTRLAEVCAEKERWREAWMASEAARRELESGVDSVTDALATIEALIRAIQSANGDDHHG